MNSLSRKLTILVPVYDCAGDLHRHSESLVFLRQKDIPIIWIASPSLDGSDLVAERLAKQAGDCFFFVTHRLVSVLELRRTESQNTLRNNLHHRRLLYQRRHFENARSSG